MTDVMISYSRKDLPFVTRLHEELSKLERDVWVDFEDIPKTADWWQEIRRGIEEADNFAFVISPDSIESEVCGWEIQHAIELKKRLIPILHRDITSPETKAKMREELNAHNWIFARDNDDFTKAFDELIKAMDSDLEYIRAHTRLLNRALEWDKAQRDPSLLLRGNDLYTAEDWLSRSENKTPPPDMLHQSYIADSRRILRNARRRFAFATGVTVVITILLIFSVWMGIRAETQREIAVNAERESLALALASNAQLSFENGKQDLSIALAIEANNISNEAAPQRALANVGYAPGTRLFMRINSPVSSSLVTPDGRYAVTGSDDSIIRIWDLETGEQVDELQEHTNAIWGLSMTPDGKYLVSGSEDTTLIIWDFESREPIRTLTGHNAAVWDVAFAPNGETIASAGEDGTIYLWDGQSGSLLTVLEGHDGPVWTVRYSPDSKKLISGGADRRVIVWDVENREIIRRYSLHKNTVTDVAFAPDSSTFYSASLDTSVIESDIQGQTELGFPGQRHTEAITAMTISPDGTHVATGSRDNRVIIWDTGRNIPVISFSGHFGTVATLAFSPDGNHLLSGAEDGTIRYWDLQNGAVTAIHNGRRGNVWSVAFSQDGKYIIGNNDMELVDFTTGEIKGTFSFDTVINNIEFSPDGSLLVGAAEEGHVYIWDTATFERIHDFTGHEGEAWTALFTPDGKYVISGATDTRLLMWDVETGEIIRTFDGHKGAAWTGDLSSDGSLLVSGSDKGELFLWDVETGELLKQYETEKANFNQLESSLEIFEVAFSSDDKLIATADTNNLVRVWDVETGAIVQQFDGHRGLVSTVAFSADNSYLISGGYDNEIIMWDVSEGVEVRRFTGHTNVVTDANISPDGNFIVSGSSGGVMRVWFVHTQDELLEWVQNNRHIHQLNCYDRAVYGFDVEDCESNQPPGGAPLQDTALPQGT